MIGSEDLANVIANIVIHLDVWDDVDTTRTVIPEGWKYIGSGACRHAFLGPDGYVYKRAVFDNPEMNEDSYRDGMEILAATKARECSFDVAPFDWFLDSDIFVQEFAEGVKADDFNEIIRWQEIVRDEAGRFFDVNSGNILFREGHKPVLIDW